MDEDQQRDNHQGPGLGDLAQGVQNLQDFGRLGKNGGKLAGRGAAALGRGLAAGGEAILAGVGWPVIIGVVGVFVITLLIAVVMQSPGNAQSSPAASPSTSQLSLKFRCQYDSRWTTNSCNITHSGCDPTALSTIVSSYGNTDLDPLTVASKNGDMGCQGATTMDDIANSLSWVQNLGYTVAKENLAYERDFDLQGAKKYIDQGYLILGVANVTFLPSGSGGHSFVITGVDTSSQNLTVLDPTYCTSDDNYTTRTLNINNVICRNYQDCGWYMAVPIKK